MYLLLLRLSGLDSCSVSRSDRAHLRWFLIVKNTRLFRWRRKSDEQMLVRNKVDHKTCSDRMLLPKGISTIPMRPLAKVTRSYYVTCRHQRFAVSFCFLLFPQEAFEATQVRDLFCRRSQCDYLAPARPIRRCEVGRRWLPVARPDPRHIGHDCTSAVLRS